MRKLFGTVDSIGPTILRLALGVIMLLHGVGKIHPVEGVFPGQGLTATVGWLTDNLHVPLPLAYVGALAEGVGGALLVLGVLTRLGGLLIAGQMAVAAWLGGHLGNGFFMNWFGATRTVDGRTVAAGEGYETHIAYIAMALALVILGGGKASIDALIGGTGPKK
jgi:putative oxidoreductase